MMDEAHTESLRPPAQNVRKAQDRRSLFASRRYTVVNRGAAISSAVEPEERLIGLEGRAIPDRTGAEEVTWLRNRLVVAVRAVCPCWLHDHQQDIVQVAMIAVLKQQEKVEGGRRFPSSYIRQAAFSAMIDEMRRRRRRGEVPLETADEEIVLVEARASPERHTMSGEISAGVRDCLDRMAPPRRAAVTLHLLAYKVPQIAEKMGWDQKRADNLVYRGMQDLRECLRKKGLQP